MADRARQLLHEAEQPLAAVVQRDEAGARRGVEVPADERLRPRAVVLEEGPARGARAAVVPQEGAAQPRLVRDVLPALRAPEGLRRRLEVLRREIRPVAALDELQAQLDVAVGGRGRPEAAGAPRPSRSGSPHA
jgi:hypothetical protein